VIQAHHRSEVARIESGCVALGDQRIRVRGIADDEHTDVAIRDCIERLALRREDLRIRQQQILALHARAARTRADQQSNVAVLERDPRVVGRDDLVERRERAVVELHDHALQRAERRRDFQQVQVDRLIGAEHLAGRDTEGEGITDLAGGAGDRNVDGTLHKPRLST
jgi:hypothetical protein